MASIKEGMISKCFISNALLVLISVVALVLTSPDLISGQASFREKETVVLKKTATLITEKESTLVKRFTHFISSIRTLRRRRSQEIVFAGDGKKVISFQGKWRVQFAVLLAFVAISIVSWRIRNLRSPWRNLENSIKEGANGRLMESSAHPLELNEEFDNLVESIAKMGDEIDKIQSKLFHTEHFHAIGKVFASFLHEIKNPLTGILLNAEMAQREIKNLPNYAPKHELENHLNSIVDNTRRASRKISCLMQQSRKNFSGPLPIAMKVQLQRAVENLRAVCQTHGVCLIQEFPVDELYVAGCADAFQELFSNLLLNAIWAMKKTRNKMLLIRMFSQAEKVIIVVEDTGSGIPRESLTKIFIPFFTTKPPGEGTGLGLSICLHIVKTFRGTLEVNSQLNEGSQFCIRFPLYEPEDALPEK